MNRYVVFNKPFQVLTQFTDDNGRATLADYIDIPDVYSAGRLDFDSEGLLVLTNDGQLIHSMMDPIFKTPKTYYAQVEGHPEQPSLERMRAGLELKDGLTQPCKVEIIEQPNWLWQRTPPIRERKAIPTCWLSITITEGKNRQVRRMTAAIGHPTLRLVRYAIGTLTVEDLSPGTFQETTLETITDNGINYQPKKSSPKTAFHKSVKRPDQRPLRNQRPQTQNRKGGKTRPDSLRNR